MMMRYARLPCGHRFHRKCIRLVKRCPLCKRYNFPKFSEILPTDDKEELMSHAIRAGNEAYVFHLAKKYKINWYSPVLQFITNTVIENENIRIFLLSLGLLLL